jgi:Domain of unknown function (DUF4160)
MLVDQRIPAAQVKFASAPTPVLPEYNSINPQETQLPAISMFYGIVIYLYFFDDERHKLPHIHARFQGLDASFSILDGSVLAGDIPTAKLKLVQAWIEIHREELVANWELAVSGQPPFAIDPLR